MDNIAVERFILNNKKYLPENKIMYLKEKLQSAPEDRLSLLSAIEFLDGSVFFIFCVSLGGFGVDRFMFGDIGMGVLKLLTGGCCGILWLIDICTITNKTKEDNFNEIMSIL